MSDPMCGLPGCMEPLELAGLCRFHYLELPEEAQALHERLDELDAENKRLREAHEEIRQFLRNWRASGCTSNDYSRGYEDGLWTCSSVSNKALENGDE